MTNGSAKTTGSEDTRQKTEKENAAKLSKIIDSITNAINEITLSTSNYEITQLTSRIESPQIPSEKIGELQKILGEKLKSIKILRMITPINNEIDSITLASSLYIENINELIIKITQLPIPDINKNELYKKLTDMISIKIDSRIPNNIELTLLNKKDLARLIRGISISDTDKNELQEELTKWIDTYVNEQIKILSESDMNRIKLSFRLNNIHTILNQIKSFGLHIIYDTISDEIKKILPALLKYIKEEYVSKIVEKEENEVISNENIRIIKDLCGSTSTSKRGFIHHLYSLNMICGEEQKIKKEIDAIVDLILNTMEQNAKEAKFSIITLKTWSILNIEKITSRDIVNKLEEIAVITCNSMSINAICASTTLTQDPCGYLLTYCGKIIKTMPPIYDFIKDLPEEKKDIGERMLDMIKEYIQDAYLEYIILSYHKDVNPSSTSTEQISTWKKTMIKLICDYEIKKKEQCIPDNDDFAQFINNLKKNVTNLCNNIETQIQTIREQTALLLNPHDMNLLKQACIKYSRGSGKHFNSAILIQKLKA